MIITPAIALAIVLIVAAFAAWAFLPARYLPGNRARHLGIRLHLGFAHVFSLWLRWSTVADLGPPGPHPGGDGDRRAEQAGAAGRADRGQARAAPRLIYRVHDGRASPSSAGRNGGAPSSPLSAVRAGKPGGG